MPVNADNMINDVKYKSNFALINKINKYEHNSVIQLFTKFYIKIRSWS